jgi:very-short-patch-repair endonuclease
VLEVVDPDHQTAMRSKLEEAFFVMSRRHGIERPRVNERVDGWRVDFHWPSRRVVVELDSAGFHLNRIAFERDRRQDEELQLAGWLVLRFTYRRVARAPREVLAAVERALAPANMGRVA